MPQCDGIGLRHDFARRPLAIRLRTNAGPSSHQPSPLTTIIGERIRKIQMATWLKDVVRGLETRNGIASLAEIYEEVRKIRPLPHPRSFDAIIRREIESHSSDSETYTGKADLFYSVDGLGAGVWGVRKYLSYTPVAADADLPRGASEPGRHRQEIYRILRDTNLARQIKLLHQNKCQLCGGRIELSNGNSYAEAHHIRPLGSPHHGPDVAENIIVLCPNHHVILDYGVGQLSAGKISMHPKHTIGAAFIAYHNDVIHGRANSLFNTDPPTRAG